MNNQDALTKIFSGSEEISSRVLNIPEVLLHIFKYLDDRELQHCGEVCSLWKDVTEEVLYKKIAIFRKKIPITILNTLPDNSEKLRSVVGYSDKFEYLWFHLEPFDLCHSVKPHSPRLLTTRIEEELCHARVFVHKNKDGGNIQLPFNVHSPTEDEIEINIAMFPSVPGFNIRHFSFTSKKCLRIRLEKMPYVSELLQIPEKKLKCVIGFTDYGIDFHDDGNGAYNGYSLEKHITRGIAFYGERVQAVILRIDRSYYCIKENFDRLKRLKPKIVKEKCFAFIFFSYIRKKGINEIVEAFKAEFPFFPFLVHHCSPTFVVLNQLENYNFDCVKNIPFKEFARIVFVWYE
ncbi:uncharacterized protein LOC111630725 isoform X2 [Centruroides sculpturatus]|nr:uncharacterized protein LOC111630725 isoform X2 [Centruroides sculpturatus]